MKTAFAVLLLTVPVLAAVSQITLEDEGDILGFEELFLDHFVAERYQEAFDLFRGNQSGIPLSDVESLEAGTAGQLTSLRGRYGPAVDYVFLGAEAVEEALIQHLYLVRYQHHALRLRFIYYNNAAIWRLNFFSWDDSVDELFSW
jgi:hypothetical protein